MMPDRMERKLSAILAADVAGYSRLMGLDEARTLAELTEHRQVIDELIGRRGGRIDGDRSGLCRHRRCSGSDIRAQGRDQFLAAQLHCRIGFRVAAGDLADERADLVARIQQ